MMTVDKAIKGMYTAVQNLEAAKIASDKIVSKQNSLIEKAQYKKDVAEKESEKAERISNKIAELLE